MEHGEFMPNQQLLEIYEALPFRFKCQVQHLLIHLVVETREAGVNLDKIEKLGTLMADDFNEPMKEFHDYMYKIDVAFIDKIEKLKLADQHKIEAMVDEMLLKTETTRS